MNKKDQDAIAKLYMENSDMSEFETEAPYREDEPFEESNPTEKTVNQIIQALENMRLPSNVIIGMIRDLINPNNLEDVKHVLREFSATRPKYSDSDDF